MAFRAFHSRTRLNHLPIVPPYSTGRRRHGLRSPAATAERASSVAITEPTTAYTTAAMPQFTATLALALVRLKTLSNGCASHLAASLTAETIPFEVFAPSR